MFLKPGLFKAITFRKPLDLPVSYWMLVGLRFLLTLLPQTGYLHPDEYFQNIEVIAGDIFNIDVAKTWEFNPKFPIRNIFVPKIVFGPPLHFIRIANPYMKHYFDIDLKTPYYLIVIPRLFICCLSLINDFCLYRICILYGQNFRNRLRIFASSYVVLVYCCRSFSNTFEMIFFSLLLLLVTECMLKSDRIIYHDEYLKEKYEAATTPVEKVKLFKLQNLLPYHSLNRVFTITTIVVIGTFNRPTFVGFAFTPVFFWLHRGLGSKVVSFKDFNIRIFSLILCSLPTILILIVIDSGYYGYLTIADIESTRLGWDNWVVTPWNFLKYNSDMQNLHQHGIHPRWLHIVANVPLLFNVLGGLVFLTLISNTYRFFRGQYGKLPRIQSITGLMLFSFIVPVAVLSMFPHQEARFIIPVLVPLVYLHGNHLHANESDSKSARRLKKALMSVWLITNVVLTVFFGFVHQGGVYFLAKSLYKEIKSVYGVQTHVITTHSYSIPTFLLQLESTSQVWTDKKTGHKYKLAPSTYLYKYGSLPMKELFQKIDDVLSNAEMLLHESKKKYRFYVVTPCSLEREIEERAKRFYYYEMVEEFSYYPHFCSEALPKFPNARDEYCVKNHAALKNESVAIDLGLWQRISCYVKRFCFKVYAVKALNSYKIK